MGVYGLSLMGLFYRAADRTASEHHVVGEQDRHDDIGSPRRHRVHCWRHDQAPRQPGYADARCGVSAVTYGPGRSRAICLEILSVVFAIDGDAVLA